MHDFRINLINNVCKKEIKGKVNNAQRHNNLPQHIKPYSKHTKANKGQDKNSR